MSGASGALPKPAKNASRNEKDRKRRAVIKSYNGVPQGGDGQELAPSVTSEGGAGLGSSSVGSKTGVGSRAPIRGPLPLLGSATGSQGSLRRMCYENLPVWIGKRLT
jgi:hypothetical protein